MPATHQREILIDGVLNSLDTSCGYAEIKRHLRALNRILCTWGGLEPCNDCGNYCDPDEMHDLSDGDRVCENCRENYYTCESCDDMVHSDYIHTFGDSVYCGDCYRERYSDCAECGHTYHNDDLYWHEGNERSYCSDCLPPESDRWSFIQSYGKKFRAIHPMRYKHESSLAMGIEIEVEANDNWTSAEFDQLDGLMFKEDGSLSDGVEIVSQPMTLRHIRAQTPWTQRFRESLKRLRKNGFTAWDACKDGHDVGMHIHIPKYCLSRFERTKLFRLVYENPSLFCSISGRGKSIRKDGHYAEINGHKAVSSYYTDSIRKVVIKTGKGEYSPSSRYVALNFTPEKTIEFRLFRSSLVFERIVANMEFVAACVEYVQMRGFSDMTGGKFLSFLANNRKRFRHLAAVLLSKIQTDESL